MSANIGQIGQIVPGLQNGIGNVSSEIKEAGGPSFTELFGKIINATNNLQGEAAQAQQLAATGEAADLHQVMISVEEAGIAMDLLLEIRNKLIDAYQTLVRMPM
jgi:flagellar hook-basal body complex protein FliE